MKRPTEYKMPSTDGIVTHENIIHFVKEIQQDSRASLEKKLADIETKARELKSLTDVKAVQKLAQEIINISQVT